MNPLYHPNALPAHVREKLPNPSRPIDERVIPARFNVGDFDERFDPIYNELSRGLSYQEARELTNFMSYDMAEAYEQGAYCVLFPANLTPSSLIAFLQQHQQKQSHAHWLDPTMNFEDFAEAVRPLGQKLIETVVHNHPDIYPDVIENWLFLKTDFWQNLLALYLIAQCKTRKTFNPDLNLQVLSEQMNAYIMSNFVLVAHVTQNAFLQISPNNVAFAVLAMGGKLSKTGTLGERVTNLSSNHFLANFK